jgi:hypothetical protein
MQINPQMHNQVHQYNTNCILILCCVACGPLDLLVIQTGTNPKVIQRFTCCAAWCYAAEDHDPTPT